MKVTRTTRQELERFTPQQLCGDCVVCGCRLTEADYNRQTVVAAVGREGTVVICVKHLTEDGPDGPKYKQAIKLFAEAKSQQLLDHN